MKRAALLVAALFVVAAVGVGAQGTNFAGTWAFDQAKSQMPQAGGGGGRGPGGGGPMTIAQTAAELTIERAGMGGQTMKSVYKLDGSESVNPGGRGGDSKSTCKWDGGKLTIKTLMTFGENTMETTAVYSLSADGKVLTVEQTRQSPNGEVKSTMVYNKQ